MRLERWWHTVPLRLRSLFRSRDVERELDEELRFHVDRQIDEHVARGMTPEQARTVVLRALGGLERRKEECRDTRRVHVIENVFRDAQYAIRSLRASPGFSAAAILSLALGIGSNTAIFSLIDTLSLRTLPVTAPDRLAMVSGGGSPNGLWTYAIWDQIRQHSESFGGACAWGAPGPAAFRFNLVHGGEMRPIDGIFASGSYFATLGVPALLGRTFSERDDARGGGPDGPVAVISHAFWQRHFGAAASAIGATLLVNQVPLTIVGVTPPRFFGPEVGRSIDITVPLAMEPLFRGRDSYLDHEAAYFLNVMLRLERGPSLETATAALRTVQPRIRDGAMPSRGREQFLQKPFTLTSAAAGTSGLRTRYERPLLAVFVVVMLVLLIACANIANLLLARAAARRHELTVRLALGAGRWRLAQQLFVESFVLSLAGAAIGLVFAIWGSRVLVAYLTPDGNPVFLDLAIDGRVLLFTIVVAFATTLLFGTAPALHAAAVKPIDALREHGRGPAAARRAGVSSAIVVAQVALSIVLVVAAGLFLRTFTRLADLSPGFDADRVLIVNVNVGRSHTDTRKRLDLFQRLADSASASPRVARAAASATTPLSRNTWSGSRVEVQGAPPLPDQESRALTNFVSPGWFATYGTPLIAGRDVEERDTASAPFVVVVNEAFVRKFFAGRDALGGTITQFPDRTIRSVVGIVRDAVYHSPREPVPPTMYVPLRQYNWWNTPFSSVSISVRAASGSPVDLARGVGAALTEVDRDLAFTFRSLEDQVNASVAQERLLATLASFFGALALLLAGVGLYGITSYAVNRRRSELGIRLALGAAPRGIVRLVVARVFVLVALGVAFGVAASLWASRFVATLLYGLEPRDPATLVGASLVLSAIAAAAAWLPAWRASRIDPAHVLRGALVLMVMTLTDLAAAQEARPVVFEGRSIRVHIAGTDRPTGGPVVVFESGAGTGLASWASVHTEVGQFARAIAYDRAGIGLSEPDGQIPTPRHVATKLRRLLVELRLPPPYVLVGHSWGGPLIRMFAGLFPQDVAGMVYVDSTHLPTREQELEYLLASGYTPDGARQHIERHREQLARFISSRSGPYRAEMEVIRTNEENYAADFRSLPPVPAIPVSVLISGRFDAAIWAKRPCEPKACYEQWLRHRTTWLKTFAPDARPEAVIVAHESGHEIQADAPALVVAAIRRVVLAATNTSKR